MNMTTPHTLEPSREWRLFRPDGILPLPEFAAQWAEEDGVAEAVILDRMTSLLSRTDADLLIYEDLAVSDPVALSALRKVIKSGDWDQQVTAHPKEMMRRYLNSDGDKAMAEALVQGKRSLSLRVMMVDCETLTALLSDHGLPIPRFLMLKTGQSGVRLKELARSHGQPKGLEGEQSAAAAAPHSMPQEMVPARGDAEPAPPSVEERLLSVKQFCQKHRAFKEGGLRHLIFHEGTNGLAGSGAIVRVGRRVLLHEERFFAWVQARNDKPTP